MGTERSELAFEEREARKFEDPLDGLDIEGGGGLKGERIVHTGRIFGGFAFEGSAGAIGEFDGSGAAVALRTKRDTFSVGENGDQCG